MGEGSVGEVGGGMMGEGVGKKGGKRGGGEGYVKVVSSKWEEKGEFMRERRKLKEERGRRKGT